jgi:hypothetical protein
MVIGFDRFRQRRVGDEADVRLVDAHPERDGGGHHDAILLEEGVLVAASDGGVEPRMIGERLDAPLGQRSRHRLGVLAGRAVDDAALTLVPLDEREHLAPGIVLGPHGEADVRSVEALEEDAGWRLEQASLDILPGREVGGRRESDRLHAPEGAAHLSEKRVFRAEVVSPLGHAMSLVDGQEAHVRARQPGDGGRLGETLRRSVEEPHRSVPHRPCNEVALACLVRGGEASRLDTIAAQLRDLVAHQRDEGRDDDGQTSPQERRKLVA